MKLKAIKWAWFSRRMLHVCNRHLQVTTIHVATVLCSFKGIDFLGCFFNFFHQSIPSQKYIYHKKYIITKLLDRTLLYIIASSYCHSQSKPKYYTVRWTLLDIIGHYWTLLNTIGHYWTLLDTIGLTVLDGGQL